MQISLDSGPNFAEPDVQRGLGHHLLRSADAAEGMMAPRNAIAAIKQSFLQEKERLEAAFRNTPDARLNWSPSPTARTPIALVAHAAYAIGSVHQMLMGEIFSIPSTAEADRGFREFERDFTTRNQALDLLRENSETYVFWLDNLPPSRLKESVVLPFLAERVSIRSALGIAESHTRWHRAQLDYVQTIYGDHDWHIMAKMVDRR